MEDYRARDDPMDIEPTKSRSLPSAAYVSPSYTPPELQERTDQQETLKKDYNKAAAEDDETRRGDRRKSKAKAKAHSSEEDYDDPERKAPRGKAIARSSKQGRDNDDEKRPDALPRTATPEALESHPTAAEAIGTDMDEHWAGYGMRFGDADAAMNEYLSSPSTPSSSYNYEADSENDPSATSAVRKALAGRRGLAKPGDSVTLQQQQQAGRGRGRGRGWKAGTGEGLEWMEPVTRKTMEDHEGAYDDDPYPSPAEDDWQWELYDESVWDRATERFEEPEAEKVALQVPAAMKAEGSNTRATDSNRVTDKDPTRQGGDFVRAMTDYKAINPGIYLSYEKDDVMRVIDRNCDGRLTGFIWGFAEMHVH